MTLCYRAKVRTIMMTFSDYQNLPGINASFLKACAKSAYDGWNYLNIPTEPTDAMNFGTALHAALLEPTLYRSDFAISEKFDRRTKIGKENSEAFERMNAGKTIITTDDAEMIAVIQKNCMKFDFIARALQDAAFEKERTLFFKNEAGIDIKGRLDIVNFAENIIVDVKTTKNADAASFGRDFINFGYDVQMLHYSKLTPLGKEPKLYVIACETTTGEVALYDVAEIVYRNANKVKYIEAMSTALDVMKMQKRPAKYDTVVQTLTAPSWA